eukprot:722692-Rhodomonas_salina.1
MGVWSGVAVGEEEMLVIADSAVSVAGRVADSVAGSVADSVPGSVAGSGTDTWELPYLPTHSLYHPTHWVPSPTRLALCSYTLVPSPYALTLPSYALPTRCVGLKEGMVLRVRYALSSTEREYGGSRSGQLTRLAGMICAVLSARLCAILCALLSDMDDDPRPPNPPILNPAPLILHP